MLNNGRVWSNLYNWILVLESGKVIARTTLQHVIRNYYLYDDVKRKNFDRSVEERLSHQNFMADPANGFYIQDEPGKVPNGIARTKEDYGEMTISDTLDADDINDNLIDKCIM